jgi:hypothetical protein
MTDKHIAAPAMKRKRRRAATASHARQKSSAHFERGIQEFLSATTAVIADIAASRITPTVANAIFARQCASLKMLELQLRGTSGRILDPGC